MDTDEGIRDGGTLDTMARLATVFRAVEHGGVITAGNSSRIGDGAAALLMTTAEKATQLGLAPIARVHTAVLAAADR